MKSLIAAAVLATALPAIAVAQTPPAAEAPAAPFYSTAKTTIGALIDNPATKAVFAKYLPEVLADERLPQALGMTLRDAQQYAPEMITDEKLAKMDADLKSIPAPAKS